MMIGRLWRNRARVKPLCKSPGDKRYKITLMPKWCRQKMVFIWPNAPAGPILSLSKVYKMIFSAVFQSFETSWPHFRFPLNSILVPSLLLESYLEPSPTTRAGQAINNFSFGYLIQLDQPQPGLYISLDVLPSWADPESCSPCYCLTVAINAVNFVLCFSHLVDN